MASGVTRVVVEVAAVPAAFLDVFKAQLVGVTNAAATAPVRHWRRTLRVARSSKECDVDLVPTIPKTFGSRQASFS